MGQVSRRSVAVGGLTLLAASEVSHAAAPQEVTPPEATVTFPEPITAMCEVQIGKLAVATGAKLYIIKIR